jgi:ABC-2 type transport system permease protein
MLSANGDGVRPALIELTSARLKEFIRETEAVFWVFGFPLLLTLGLGFAFREKPPDRIPIGVISGPAAEARLRALAASPALLPRIYTERDGRDALRRGKISLLVSDGVPMVYQFDPTRPDARTASVEADEALEAAAGRRNVFTAREQIVHEQGSRYIDFLVPGLLGMNLMGTGMWGMGFTIANARMKKLLKRLVATPMRKSDYLIAQFLSRLVFLVVEIVVVVGFAWIAFGVRINGSILLFSFVCLLGGMAFAAIGLLVASRAQTLEAVSGLMNFVMMPMWLCSGVFFSYERFPDAAKPLIRALPLTALNDALRAVMNDAATAGQLIPQLANLAVWTALAYVAGLRMFRWQ